MHKKLASCWCNGGAPKAVWKYGVGGNVVVL